MPIESKMLKREILAGRTRIVDDANGVVDFCATSATPDSYDEIVDPKGADTSRFQRNAPLIDSHDYSTVLNIIGKVLEVTLQGVELVMRCQFAIDVPSNLLAQKAFAMVKAGYLRACSIGFIPTQICRPSDGDWKSVCEDLGLGGLENSVRCVYQKWQLLELSICAIGANPDAVAKAYSAGILEDADLLRVPQWRRSLQSASPQSATPKIMSDNAFLARFAAATKSTTSAPTVTQAAEELEFARRGRSETELFRSCGAMRYALARRQRITAHERALEMLQDPLVKEFLNALPRYAANMSYLDNSGPDLQLVRKSLTIAPGSLGGSLLPIDVCDAIVDLIYIYGAHARLGLQTMFSTQTKFAAATGNPSAVVIPASLSGTTTIPTDTALTGANLSPEAATFATLVTISRELLADAKVNLAYYVLTRFAQGLAQAVDYCAFMATGATDTTSGGMTGIFADNTIATVNAAQGSTTVAQLARADFMAVVAAVSPSALQRPCCWYLSPALLPALMLLVDGQAHDYLVATPAQTQDGTFRLIGFEIVLTAVGPANNAAGQLVAAFGAPEAYLVGIREQLEVILSDGATGFSSNSKSFRALTRGWCQTQNAAGMAKLALAAA